MAARRALVVLLVMLTGMGLGWLLLLVLAPGGWTAPKIAMLLGFAGTTPWTGLCLANGLIGFLILLCRRDPVRAVFPVSDDTAASPLPQTAVVVTIRDEDMRRVLPPLRRMLDGLDRAGAGKAFEVFFLSDTGGAGNAAAEAAAIAAFRSEDPDPPRVHYRRRPVNAGFKAGNIMDFLDHHAEGFAYMLTLDADSAMSADAVLRLVGSMQADPALGIVQHLTVGLPASSVFPRLFQFGMRAGMRSWTIGQAWWQGDEGPYWGHNALVRIAPFRIHCRLPGLRDGRPILSHDQVEAAVLRAAGWGVRVLPVEDGSYEANPPALPEFLSRELRWQAGNLQYWHLLGLPGLRPAGRWQLMQAMLLFAGAPLYLLFLAGAAIAAATDGSSPFPAGPALALTGAWLGALYAPKLLGYAEVAMTRSRRAAYGGGGRFALGVAAEAGFTLLLDAVSAVAKTVGMLRLARGTSERWEPQNRADRGVGWIEAMRLLWPQTLLGIGVFACFAQAGWRTTLWALPLAGGLLAAVPLCVLTAHPAAGRWARERRIAAVPEELPDLNAPRCSRASCCDGNHRRIRSAQA